MKIKGLVSNVLMVGAVISFTALITVVFIQIFARFVLPKAPSWTEEASRFLFIYSVAFSAPLALKRGEYVRVDILVNKIPEKIREKLDEVIYAFLSVFFLIIAFQGVNFARLGTIQTSPALTLPMVIPYASIALSSLFICGYSMKNIISIHNAGKIIKNLKKKEKEDREEMVEEWN